MSMITDKRNEVANKLNTLLMQRQASINERVAAFKAQLEAEPLGQEILDTKKLLAALDDVIACEAVLAQPVVEPVVAEPVIAPNNTISVAEADIASIEEVAVESVPETAEIAEVVEVQINPETKEAEIVNSEVEARPGMAYVGIPERR